MFRSLTNDANTAFSTDDLAIAAHLFDGSANFHNATDELATERNKTKSSKILRDDWVEARDADPLETERDSCFCEIIWTDLNFDVIAWQNADAIFSQLACQVPNDFAVVFEFHAKASRGKTFQNLTAHFNKVFFRHNLRYRTTSARAGARTAE